ncbi:class B sortase [Acetanaerobacterium elongatum]|uniref:Sortase B n=1 Tax=Acetanaerobacterium elongatum TaxID=258515 RepID=A0A1H0CN10_9FIRM|nr:class B sortase [Acetanaerobacterium elongatum]SDN59297.1 sortase B [Acetanaerobacterium elongatum]
MQKNNKRLQFKLCSAALWCVLLTLFFSSCSPAAPVIAQEVVSTPEPEYSSSHAVIGSSSDEEPPYGVPKIPGKELTEKLAQTFPVGKAYGWLTVPGTTIDNAVMYSPESNDVYLEQRINYEGKESKAGLIFADYRDNMGNRNELCRNTVIYGHNVEIWGSNNGKRFSQLLKYTDLDFAKNNQFITFSTPTDEMVWQVFATFYTDTNLDYVDTNPSDEKLMYIVSEAGQRTENFFDVEVTPKDKILTLSTCAYDFGVVTKRFVVMAKLLDSNAVFKPAEVIKNESPKKPS